jgi:hypothetical protein
MQTEQRKYSGLSSESLFKKIALSFAMSPGSPIGSRYFSDSPSANRDMSQRLDRANTPHRPVR